MRRIHIPQHKTTKHKRKQIYTPRLSWIGRLPAADCDPRSPTPKGTALRRRVCGHRPTQYHATAGEQDDVARARDESLTLPLDEVAHDGGALH